LTFVFVLYNLPFFPLLFFWLVSFFVFFFWFSFFVFVVQDLPAKFMARLLETLDHPDLEAARKAIVLPLLDRVRGEVANMILLDAAVASVRALAELVRSPGVATLLLQHADWLPQGACTGREFETRAYLAPFFRPTAVPEMHPSQDGTLMRPYDCASYYPVESDGRINGQRIESSHAMVPCHV
jgi:hypothetical protein